MSNQGTQEWLMERMGHVTASRIADVMTEPRSKAAKSNGDLSQSAISYMRELRAELLCQSPNPSYTSAAMQWGHDWEPIARDRYAADRNVEVVEVGFVRHKTEELIGCSPDGLVGDDGMIQIKCPYTRREMEAYRDGEIEKHIPQMQFEMYVCERAWNEFVGYHPDYGAGLDLVVHRVDRDEAYIQDMAIKAIEFRDQLLESYRRVIHG